MLVRGRVSSSGKLLAVTPVTETRGQDDQKKGRKNARKKTSALLTPLDTRLLIKRLNKHY